MHKIKALPALFILFFTAAKLFAQQEPAASVVLNGRSISIMKAGKPLITIDSISFNFIAPQSQSVIYNSADSIVIQLTYKQVPEFYMINTDRDHDERITITHKNGVFHFYANPHWARNFTIHLAESNDHYFGLMEALFPENKKSPDLRGQVVDVEVIGDAARLFENYASVWSAFFFNPKGYASFVNTFAKGRYELAINGKSSIQHETGKLDWYIFTGDHQKIYQSYYKVIGKPKFVPLWACGPMIWRDEDNNGKADVLNDAKQFAALKIPVASLMVDRPYSNGAQQWSKMDFNSKFAKPEEWIKELNTTYGMQFLTWIAPATFTDRDFPALLPGSFGYIDLSNPEGKAEFARRLKQSQYTFNVRGHKMDRADEQFPQTEPWYDKTSEAERRNKYVYLYTKVTDSILKDAWGNDQFTFTRAGYHGCQPYLSGLWGGDVRTSWDGMAANLANSMRVSYMGFPNWGTDGGGYSGTGLIPDDLYIRWLQWSAFNGINEIKLDGGLGRGPDRVPWKYSVEVQNAFRKAGEQRMEWLPHIFSQLNTSAKYGPVMKPLGMIYPEDEKTLGIWDEYIFGNTLLVAPIVNSSNKRTVYLPKGDWLDFYTKKLIPGNQTISITAALAEIPLFIKSNSFQLLGNMFSGNRKVWDVSSKDKYVDVYYYPGNGQAEIDFIDANQQNADVVLKALANNKKISLSVPAISYTGKIKIFLREKPSFLTVNNKTAKINYMKDYLVIDRSPKHSLNIVIGLK